MKKPWLILYTSVTGNTRKIAEAMYSQFGANEADIISITEPYNLDEYENIAIGYWLTRGAAPPNMLQVLPKIQHKTVVLFQTHGAEVGSEHSNTSFARTAMHLGEGCYVLATFSSQGAINPKLLARRRNTDPNDPHSATKRNQERWAKAAAHPNEDDFQNARDFVDKCRHKLELRKRYLLRQLAKETELKAIADKIMENS